MRGTGPTPVTEALSISEGRLVGPGVDYRPIHQSWHYAHLRTDTGKPKAIVAHYTSTDPGTALAMQAHRADALKPTDRQASWHVSIETDGTVLQMASLLVGCWHAGGPTAKPVPGIGAANRVAVGIELVGHGKYFPPAQVKAATLVWSAIAHAYQIPRALAMITHQQLDPTRKSDPGPVWMTQHAPSVLAFCYGA